MRAKSLERPRRLGHGSPCTFGAALDATDLEPALSIPGRPHVQALKAVRSGNQDEGVSEGHLTSPNIRQSPD